METQDQLVLAGVVVGLVEAMKQAGLPTRLAGALAVLLGVGVVMLWTSDIAHWRGNLLDGLTVGLVAAGLYSQARSQLAAGDAPG